MEAKAYQRKWISFLIVSAAFLFLFLTTLSKSYAFISYNNLDIPFNYLAFRAFCIWITVIMLAPLNIFIAGMLDPKEHTLMTFGVHTLLSVAMVPIYSSIYLFLMMNLWFNDIPNTFDFFFNRMRIVMTQYSIIGPLSYLSIVTMWYFKKKRESFISQNINNHKISRELSFANMQVLKAQLQPHFLFNALHNINTLLHQDTIRSRRILSQLKQFLIISTNRDNQFLVPLFEELEFTNRYLEIEQTRFGDRLKVERKIEGESLPVLVPSFLMQPLVENAVRHGIEKAIEGGSIRISTSKLNDRISISIEDSGPGLSYDSTKIGIGISNLEQRLRHIYSWHVFELYVSDLGGLKVYLELPLEPEHTFMENE